MLPPARRKRAGRFNGGVGDPSDANLAEQHRARKQHEDERTEREELVLARTFLAWRRGMGGEPPLPGPLLPGPRKTNGLASGAEKGADWLERAQLTCVSLLTVARRFACCASPTSTRSLETVSYTHLTLPTKRIV